MPGRKNILKKINYDTLPTEEANFLPPCFDVNRMVVLPPIGVSSSHTKAKPMDGMHKCYDGHVRTKTQITNISNNINNDLGLVFCSSICVGHLECQNPHCDYLQRVHRTCSVNDTEFDGFTKEFFPRWWFHANFPHSNVQDLQGATQMHCTMRCQNLLRLR